MSTMDQAQDAIFQTPPTQPFQYSGQADGSAGQDVNLFQGAVGFSTPLVSLAARSGLSIDVAAVYDSGVAAQVTKSNRYAPTGVLGLGWTLQVNRIDAEYATPGNRSSAVFYLCMRGARNRLFSSTARWLRAHLDGAFAPALDQGTLPDALLQSLLAQTLPIDPSARVTVDQPGMAWTITDAAREEVLRVEAPSPGASLLVFDGGAAYEPESFDFSRVTYYAAFEKWVVVNASGARGIYGGGVRARADGNLASAGDSIAWGVKWNTYGGPSMAVRSSNGPLLQDQYPVSWMLAQEQAINLDAINYEYLQTQQAVGVGGRVYTKAIYLQRITDMLGRVATFNYAPKLFSAIPQDPREYIDPYKEVPDDAPDAFQSRYEALYLESIVCRDAQGALLTTTRLDYEVDLFCAVPTSAPPTFAGDCMKRVLTSVVQVPATGASLPPLRFRYHPASAVNSGALAEKVLPEGGVIAYSYQQKALEVCQRALRIPAQFPSAQPKVWFGGDYAVVLWVANTEFSVTAYTWSGRWIPWTPSARVFQYPLDPEDIIATLRDDFFVLSVGGANGQQCENLFFHRDNRVVGGWLEDPRSPLDLPTTRRDVVAGDGYFALANGLDNTVTLLTWDALQRTWNRAPLPTPSFAQDPTRYIIFPGGFGNLLVVLYYDILSPPGQKQSQLSLHTLDEDGTWRARGVRQAGEITIAGGSPRELEENFSWTESGWVFAATAVTSASTASAACEISLYTWDGATGEWNAPVQRSFTIAKTQTGQLPYVPQAVVQSTGLVTCGPHLLRYNGAEWLTNDNLALEQPVVDGTVFWFAQGPDVVLKTENAAGQTLCMVQAFDPNTQQSAWNEAAITVFNGAPPDPSRRLTRYYPTAGGDFITFDFNCYYRGTSTDWVVPVERPFSVLPPGTNTTTLVNESPGFLAYLQEDANGQPLGTSLMVLDTGFVASTEDVKQNFYRVVESDGRLDPDPNGRAPGGPGSFVTYMPLSGPFAQAQSLTLYRYLDDSVVSPVLNYPIVMVTTDDGFQVTKYNYAFDAATAAVSAEGGFCKYYRCAVSRGDSGENGSTVYTFINGVGAATPGNPTQDVALDGMLATSQMFDSNGTLVSSQTNTWVAVREAGDVFGGAARPLYGVYAELSQTVAWADGVSRTQRFGYDRATGHIDTTAVDLYNALGELETHTKTVVPAYTEYPVLASLNALDALSGSTYQVAAGGRPAVVTAQQSTVWKPYSGTSAGAGRLKVQAPSQWFARAMPGSGSPSTDPGQWVLLRKVNAYDEWGAVLETENGGGLVHSYTYAQAQFPQVARFAAASALRGGAYYFGFEPYETSGAWGPDYTRTPVVQTISHTGTRSLCVPPGVTCTPLALTPEDRSQPFLFSCWATSDPAASPPTTPVTGWRIEFTGGGQGDPPLPPPIELVIDSADWHYVCAAIDLRPYSAPVTVVCTLTNNGGSAVFVDNVCFSAVEGAGRATVHDPQNLLTTAEVGPFDQVKRYVYDRWQRQIATTSEAQRLQNLITPYLSRQTQATFNPSQPNSQLALQPMGETYYERFRNNGVWSRHFSSPEPDAWVSSLGRLRYTRAAPGSITFIQPAFTANYALRFDIQADAPVPVGLALGDDLSLAWDPATREWTLTDALNHTTVSGAFATPDANGTWLAVLGTDAVIFTLNGQVLFGYIPRQMPSGMPSLRPGGPVSVSEFLIGGAPQIAVKYFDGTSKARQGQSIEGTSAVVADVLFDSAGRAAVTVKPVAYDGATQGLLTFRTDVVTGFDWATGILTGKAAAEYPADQGYPYTRQRYEASPLGRLVETGAPGKDFAITDAAPAERRTTRYAYGNNSDADINATLAWPAGTYPRITSIDPDGCSFQTYANQIGSKTAAVTRTSTVNSQWAYSLQTTSYTSSGKTVTTRLPNYYAPPEGSVAAAWVNETTFDLLGRITSVTTPDAGTTRSIADDVGQVRFMQNALLAEQGLVAYTRFDLYGRIVEGGVVAAAWDPVALRRRANDPSWPSTADGARPLRRYEYGTDASRVSELAKLVCTRNLDPATGEETCANTKSYDAAGNLVQYGLALPGDPPRVTTYAYDNLGNVTSTTYSTGFTVVNERDSVGRVRRILDGDGNVLASYRYNPGDQIIEQAIVPASPGEVTTSYTYNPAGWLASSVCPVMSETLSYTQGGYQGAGYYGGRIASATTAFVLPAPEPSYPASVAFAYAYDDRGHLVVAQAKDGAGTELPAYSLGLPHRATFDANGNFLTVDDGAVYQTYRYTPNTDQAIATQAGPSADYAYNAAGGVSRAAPRGITNITYQPVSQQPLTIETEKRGTVRLVYDTNAGRARKTTTEATRTYVRGPNGWPLVEWTSPAGVRAGAAPADATEYLYGPQGLFAVRSAGKIYPALVDHLSSLRGLCDDRGKLLAAFHYTPFGAVAAQYGQAPFLRCRFTGYELDDETGLYSAIARLYDPQLKRFYACDPALQFFSPYLYGGNNPISIIDPSGEAAWWALVVGALVGIAVGVATAGAGLAAAAAIEGVSIGAVEVGVAGSVALGAVSGAAGTVAGDATTAGLSGEKFTAQRALIDVAGGAAAGGVGAAVGGGAASLAMRAALRLAPQISARTVSAIGTVTAGVVGGASGAAAQSGVDSAMTGSSFFSVGTAVNVAIGGFAGFGGALVVSGAHAGWTGKSMAVSVGRDDFPSIQMGLAVHPAGRDLITLNPEELGYYAPTSHQLNLANPVVYDTIDVHGGAGKVYPSFLDGNGNWYTRPMSGRLFAEYVQQNLPNWVTPPGPGAALPPVKLNVCYASRSAPFGKSVGQSLATALGRDVQASKTTVYWTTGAPANTWVTFHP